MAVGQTSDPLARFDSLLGDPLDPRRRRRQKQQEAVAAPSIELTPEATDSLVKSIGRTALGGVAKVGNLLDLPGSMARDVLSGSNPFDQLLTPFSDENRVSGRDLLEQWGALSKNKPGLDWGDVGAFGFEILADPLTYATGGLAALGRGGGKLAKKAGLLDDLIPAATAKAAREGGEEAAKRIGPRTARMNTSLDDLLRHGGKDSVRKAREAAKAEGYGSLSQFRREHGDEPLGGLVGWGMPFREPTHIMGQAGGRAEQIASILDRAGSAVKQSAPVRHFRALLDNRTKGQSTKYGQELGEDISRGELGAKATGKMAGMQATQEMDNAFQKFDELFGDSLRQAGDDPQKLLVDTPFKAGDVVQAGDRGNFGRVQSVTPEEALVWFRNPETGAEATKRFKFDELELANANADQLASLDPSRATFDKIMRAMAEGATPREAFEEFAPGLARRAEELVPPASATESLPSVADDMAKVADDAADALDPDDLITDKMWQEADTTARQLEAEAQAAQQAQQEAQKKFFEAKNAGGSGAAAIDPIEQRIRQVARELAEGQPGRRVYLRDLREKLSDIPPEDLNRTLMQMERNEAAILYPNQNPMELTEADNLASIPDSAGQPRHYLYMEDYDVPSGATGDLDALRVAADEAGEQALKKSSDAEAARRHADEMRAEMEQQVLPRAAEEGVSLADEAAEVPAKAEQTAKAVTESFAELFPEIKEAPELEQAMRGTLEKMVTTKDRAYKELEDLGGKTTWMQGLDGIYHFPRYVHEKIAKKSEATRLASTMFDGMKQRSPELRTLPTHVVNRLARDRDAREMGAEYIQSQYGKYLDEAFDNGFSYTDEAGRALTGKEAHAQALADWAAQHRQGDVFTRAMSEDFGDYMVGTQVAKNTIQAVQSLFVRNAIRSGGKEGIPISRALQKAYLDPERALKHMAQKAGVSVEEMRKWNVPAEVVRDVGGFIEFMNRPSWANKIVDAYDEATKILKESLTLPWPAFAGRNLGSGQFVNLTSGMIDGPGDLKNYVQAVRDVFKMRKGGGDEKLMRELEAYRVVADKGFMDVDMFQAGGKKILPDSPLDVKATRREAAQFVGDNPSAIDKLPGGRAARRGYRTVIGTGAKLNQQVEWLNRAPMFLFLRRKGFSPEEAARKVFELQFDYSQVSPFERSVMKRAMPFYSFTRFAIPQVLRTLGRHPGGALSQTIQASAEASGSDAMTPDWIADTASIPMGESSDGGSRYLTGFGLAHESPLAFLGGFQDAGLEALGMTNPIIKGPLEAITGQSFFQRDSEGGRPLDDLDPTVGRTISNVRDSLTGSQTRDAQPFISQSFEHLLANSPISRALTTARMLSDPRKSLLDKGLRLGTGIQVADVSPRVQDMVLENKAEQLLKNFPQTRQFTKTHLPTSALAEMTPEEQLQALQYKALLEALNRRSQQRQGETQLARR